MAILWRDIRYAVRVLVRNPSFSVTTLLVLTLGIGINTAVFSVVNAVMIRPLPFAQPDRIVRISGQRLSEGMENIGCSHVSILFWRDHARVFEHIAGMESRHGFVTSHGKTHYVKATAVSSCFFSVLGIHPLLGRGFLPEEERPGKDRAAILSHSFWRDHLDKDPQAIGKHLTFDDRQYTIVGIMPAGFRESYHRDTPFWVPLVLDPEGIGGGTPVWARLQPGIALRQAQARMTALQTELVQRNPNMLTGQTVKVRSLRDDELGDSFSLMWLLWGSVALVLLITCANVGALFLVRANARQSEIAMRLALGASWARVIRQEVTESLLLSLVAGALGLLIGCLSVKVLIGICPADIPRLGQAGIDLSVLLYTLGLTVLTTLACAFLPAWKGVRMRLSQSIRGMAAGLSADRRWRRLNNALVVLQIAITVTLLLSVGMLIHSLISIQKEDLGFRPAHVLLARIRLPDSKYSDEKHCFDFFARLLDATRGLPEVRSAALVSGGLELSTDPQGFSNFFIDGQHDFNDRAHWPRAMTTAVSPGFFRTMGIPILAGGDLPPGDLRGGTSGLIIDENLARKHFAGKDPLDHHLSGGPVLGVVSTIRDFGDLDPRACTIYSPLSGYCFWETDLVVRTENDPLRLADALRTLVASLDKDQEISRIETLEAKLSGMLASRRFAVVLLGLFAQIALALAAVGLYGLLHHVVTQNTREIGIRVALGATPKMITRVYLGQGVRLVLWGMGLGILGAYATSRLIVSLLYNATPTDPVTLLATAATLSAVALVATYIPTRRAARIDPMQALRYE